jgi:flagellar basal body-associated protein FliL
LAALAGIVLAYVERWATAGVVGAPIGAVLLIVVGVPIVLALAAASGFLVWMLGRPQRERVTSEAVAP